MAACKALERSLNLPSAADEKRLVPDIMIERSLHWWELSLLVEPQCCVVLAIDLSVAIERVEDILFSAMKLLVLQSLEDEIKLLQEPLTDSMMSREKELVRCALQSLCWFGCMRAGRYWWMLSKSASPAWQNLEVLQAPAWEPGSIACTNHAGRCRQNSRTSMVNTRYKRVKRDNIIRIHVIGPKAKDSTFALFV